jgi:hypothetical protein
MNQYKMDVYKVDLEKTNGIIDVEISNVISWELMKIAGTKKEIQGLADFLNQFLIEDEIKNSQESTKNNKESIKS